MNPILVADTISKDIGSTHSDIISEHNLHWIFQPLKELNLSIQEYNVLVAAIIYSYHPDSNKVNLKNDGFKINETILLGLGVDINIDIYKSFIRIENEKINEAIGNFFDLLSNQWEFVTIRTIIDNYAKILRMSDDFSSITEDEKKLKAKNELEKLRHNGLLQRKTADDLILKLKRDNMITDEMAKKNFNVSFIDENLKQDIFSWREYIHKLRNSEFNRQNTLLF